MKTRPPTEAEIAEARRSLLGSRRPRKRPLRKAPTRFLLTADDIVAELGARDILTTVEEICRPRRVPVEDVCGRGRTRAVAAARHAIWAWLKWVLRWSYPEIGALFDVDHSTVMAALGKTAEARAQAEAKFSEALSTYRPPVVRCLPEIAARCA